MVPINQLKS